MADVKKDVESADISPKMKALLALADKVRESGLSVRPEHIERARREGAADVEIHDTVLIAAAFSMYNRYVDGLATWAPEDPAAYREEGAKLAREGYLEPPPS